MTNEERVLLRGLVEEACTGNACAKGKLWLYTYAPLGPLITRGLVKRGVPYQDKDDAVHDVIVRMMGKLQDLRRPEAFLGYLIRVEQHVARMHRSRQCFVAFNQVHSRPAVGRDFPLDKRLALGRLPKISAKVVELIYVEGYTYAEAARALNSSLGAVKRMERRAVDEILELLKDDFR